MEAPPALIGYDDLAAWGYARPTVQAAAGGMLMPLRKGVYVQADAWRSAYPEQRIAARAQALARVSAARPVFSHETAAALHDLPLHLPAQHQVHVIVGDGRPGAAAGAVRHRGELAASDIVDTGGLLCTSLLRTAADIARTSPFEKAVTVVDAVLRRRCTTGHHGYSEEAARAVCADILAIARRSAHGVGRAERVLRFADGRAQLPGESISRVWFAHLGFPRPRLQVAVAAPPRGRSTHYYLDFALDQADAFGEFDGRMKYRDGRLTVDRTADDVFDEEKQREDWIRGTTGRRIVRWGWPHIRSAAVLGERMAAFGIAPA